MWLRLWIILILLLGSIGTTSLSSMALAEEGSGSSKGGDDKKKKEEEERKRREEERKKEEERDKNSGKGSTGSNSGNSSNRPETRSYYGQVTINASGQVLSGDTRIQSNSPWLKLAIPGMWVEASGTWNGDVFIASEIKLYSPQSWSYYQGPAEPVGASQYASVSAWLSTDKQNPFIALKSAPDAQNQVRLVAYFDGAKLRAVPGNFPAPPAGLKVGWVELLGTASKDGITWISAKAFP